MESKEIKNLTQKELKNEAIINSAIKIFMEKGYTAASMDEIAAHAGVSKRTVYDHFGSKETLFQDIVINHWRNILGVGESISMNTKSISTALTKFAEKFLEFLYQSKTINLFRLLISESPRFPDITSRLVIDNKGPFTRELIAYLDSQKISGNLQIADTSRAASYFMGMLKEYHFWPMMMGFTKQTNFTNHKKLIKEVVANFLKIYN